MRRFAGTLCALSLLGGTASASAESTRTRTPHDTRAKTVERTEAELGEFAPSASVESIYRTLLEAADEDRDLRVSRAELEGFVQRRVRAQVERRFQRLDRDRDGRVTRAEVPRMDARRFARFDANADAAFSLVELAGALGAQATRHCGRLLARLDVDQDGALSATDLERTPGARVAELEASAEPSEPAK